MRQSQEPIRPIACNLNTIPPEQRDRYLELRELLRLKSQGIEELADGYAFRFPSDLGLFIELAEFIILERLCCPFLSFSLELAAGDGPIWLRLTGDPEVKQVLLAELGLD